MAIVRRTRRRVELSDGIAYETCDPPGSEESQRALEEIVRAAARLMRQEQTMTMFATKISEGNPNIKVNITYGPVTASVEEHHGHLRHFHTELGALLDEMEAKDAEKAEA